MPDVDPETLGRALGACAAALERWGFAPEEAAAVLGAPSPEALSAWSRGGAHGAGDETVLRVGAVMSIADALSNLPEAEHALEWLGRRNPHLRGRTPRAELASGDLGRIGAVNAAAQSVVNW